MTVLWHLGIGVGLLGFGICAARSVCKREQGDEDGRNDEASKAGAFVILVLVCGLLAAMGA